MVKHSFQATRRRGEQQPAQCRCPGRLLSLLPRPRAESGPGARPKPEEQAWARQRRGRDRTGRGALRRATQSCPSPGPGGEGEVHRVSPGQAAGLAAEGGLFAGGGLQIRPADRPGRARRTLRTLPASVRGSQVARKVVLTPAGPHPEEERACALPRLRRDAVFPTCDLPLPDALGPSPTATEHMAMFWLIGLDHFVVVFLSFSLFFVFFFLFSLHLPPPPPSKMCRS